MTRRELEIEAYNQKLFAKEAEQKAEDAGYALELLLNDKFKLFHTATTSDKGAHVFLVGIARNVPINDFFTSAMAGSKTEDRRTLENHLRSLRSDRLGPPRKGIQIAAQ
jgi:hypothetical protein